MKTNLVFTRTTQDESGNSFNQMKVIPVDIPQIEDNSGWKILTAVDSVENYNETNTTEASQDKTSKEVEIPDGSKFQSTVAGNSRLVKSKDRIFIVQRKGKATLNQTEPNSVCIDDSVKREFFDSVRTKGRNIDFYGFSQGESKYIYWEKFMKEEYQRQRKAASKNI